MMHGMIYKNQPLIPIVIGWRFGAQEFIALIDTGFTGELKVSPETAEQLGLVISHTESVSLGNDEVVSMSASLAAVSMEGVMKTVSVLVSRGMPIVGVSFLKKFGYTLTLDFNLDTLSLQR
jgi:clan AA aspartic protease